ncbi:hypothetical protein [Crocosphaera sp.]|uniref:hypothetical protein n=1 Tax=Crocosphaera sp. TaxID=2729996 RepID=UPI002635E0A3|nr:hypothetical protein [Crocosphaera sp.]MDJ0581138.1 hypothetical protein [Crocosphaera sp.]
MMFILIFLLFHNLTFKTKRSGAKIGLYHQINFRISSTGRLLAIAFLTSANRSRLTDRFLVFH